MLSDVEMVCKTPRLSLPSIEQFGIFTVQFRFAFILDGFDKYANANEQANNISDGITVVKLSKIGEHQWPPYDPTTGGPLELQVITKDEYFVR